MDIHCQTAEPVIVPEGFRRPTLKIGQRVRVACTLFAPNYLAEMEGKTGVITCVVFCQSDGKTVLYGVRYDVPSPSSVGDRYEAFALDEI